MNDKEAWIKFARGLQLLSEQLANDLDQKTEAVASNPFPVESKLEKALGHTAPVPITSFDPTKIDWITKTGDKGPYDFATDKTNSTNSEYQKLVSLLKISDGSFTKEGKWYWLFTNGDAVGRKQGKRR